MHRALITVIFSLLISTGLENSVAQGQVWLKPHGPTKGRIYYNIDRQMRIVAGDTLSDKIKPYFTMEKWENLDCPAWLRIRQFNSDPDSNCIRGDSVIVFNGDQQQAIYMLDDGLEWSIFLKRKPASNVLSYQIFTSNLEFAYQPLELLQWEIERNAYRPDSARGAYVVYHRSRIHNEYETGQAFCIFRPKAWDSRNDTVWCDLNVDTTNGILSVTLPPDFWNNAVYPVTVDPTFGYTTAGIGNWNVGSSSCYAVKYPSDYYTASAGDNVDTLCVYVKERTGGADYAKLAIYDIDKGEPDTKIAESADFEGQNTYAWHKVAVDVTLTSGTTYCIAFGDMDGSQWNLCYSVQSDGASEYNGTALPTTWSESSSLDGRISLYAIYSTAGGVAAPSRRRKILSGGE